MFFQKPFEFFGIPVTGKGVDFLADFIILLGIFAESLRGNVEVILLFDAHFAHDYLRL